MIKLTYIFNDVHELIDHARIMESHYPKGVIEETLPYQHHTTDPAEKEVVVEATTTEDSSAHFATLRVDKLPETANCQVCGATFKPLTYKSKFCSKRCTNAYQIAKKDPKAIDRLLEKLKRENPIVERPRPNSYREMI